MQATNNFISHMSDKLTLDAGDLLLSSRNCSRDIIPSLSGLLLRGISFGPVEMNLAGDGLEKEWKHLQEESELHQPPQCNPAVVVA